jgi:hypothetical protein
MVNEHLDVAWDTSEDKVRVLVDGKPILHCAFLVAAVCPSDREITSIDDLAGIKEAASWKGGACSLRNFDIRTGKYSIANVNP